MRSSPRYSCGPRIRTREGRKVVVDGFLKPHQYRDNINCTKTGSAIETAPQRTPYPRACVSRAVGQPSLSREFNEEFLYLYKVYSLLKNEYKHFKLRKI